MKKEINKRKYDTKRDKCLGRRVSGEYGDPAGFEEWLYVTDYKQHYIYGVGGCESCFPEPDIILLNKNQARGLQGFDMFEDEGTSSQDCCACIVNTVVVLDK